MIADRALPPSIRRAFEVWSLLAGCLCVSGCSSKPSVAWGTAAGSVRIHRQSLTKGTIIFVNHSLGVDRMAAIQSDGTYVERSAGFAGLPVGQYRVAVTAQQISPGDFVAAAAPKQEEPPTPIPEKYTHAETSGLTADVKEGKNPSFDFDLEP